MALFRMDEPPYWPSTPFNGGAEVQGGLEVPKSIPKATPKWLNYPIWMSTRALHCWRTEDNSPVLEYLLESVDYWPTDQCIPSRVIGIFRSLVELTIEGLRVFEMRGQPVSKCETAGSE